MENIDKQRDILKLTFNEFENIKGFQAYWESKEDYDTVRKCLNLEFTRDTFAKWTAEYLKQFYPKVTYAVLEYKDEVIQDYITKTGQNADLLKRDTVAFKFLPDRPELYLLTQADPILFDEFRFDAYMDGPFERPDWPSLMK